MTFAKRMTALSLLAGMGQLPATPAAATEPAPPASVQVATIEESSLFITLGADPGPSGRSYEIASLDGAKRLARELGQEAAGGGARSVRAHGVSTVLWGRADVARSIELLQPASAADSVVARHLAAAIQGQVEDPATRALACELLRGTARRYFSPHRDTLDAVRQGLHG